MDRARLDDLNNMQKSVLGQSTAFDVWQLNHPVSHPGVNIESIFW